MSSQSHPFQLVPARRWLSAYGIGHVAVRYAQHMTEAVVAELKQALAEDHIRLSLIYTSGRVGVRATHDRDDLLNEAEEARRPNAPASWPRVPAVHALRFRYECRWTLSTDDFARVDALFQDACGRFGKSLCEHPRANQDELGRASSLVLACRDQNQLTIRSKAADLALISARRSIGTGRVGSAVLRRHLPEDRMRERLRQLDPLSAACEAVNYATGLPDDLRWLLGRDQVCSDEFIGTEPSPQLRPLLSALDLNGGWRPFGRAPTHSAGAPAGPRQPGDVETIQGLLHELLHTERNGSESA